MSKFLYKMKLLFLTSFCNLSTMRNYKPEVLKDLYIPLSLFDSLIYVMYSLININSVLYKEDISYLENIYNKSRVLFNVKYLHLS